MNSFETTGISTTRAAVSGTSVTRLDSAICLDEGHHTASVERLTPIQRVDKVIVGHFDDQKQINYPWGWIRWMVTSQPDLGVEMTYGIVYIKPDQENPLHMHPNCTEYLHVLEGRCEHLVGDKWVELKVGDVARIPQEVQHMARTGREGVKAVIVYDSGDRQFVQLEDQGKSDEWKT